MRRAALGGARRLAASLALLLLAGAALAQDGQPEPFAQRFDRAWRLVDQRYWGLERTGVDWDAVGDRYRPQALAAADDAAFYAVLERMYDELGDDHSVFVPPARVEEIAALYGPLPCVALFTGLPATSGRPLLAQRLPSLHSRQQLANVTYGLTPEGIGYLRVPDLASDGVAGAVRLAVTRLTEDGAWSFVLDLRGNPGGRLVSMMEVAGVFTRGLLWRAVTSWTLPLPYPALGLVATEAPLAVLIDGDVNSAAEGLAGALQARGRAQVVGRTSAGNVEALLPFCLRDGSQAWIATGVLAPLIGRTWEGQGVIPDISSDPNEAPAKAIEWLLSQRP